MLVDLEPCESNFGIVQQSVLRLSPRKPWTIFNHSLFQFMDYTISSGYRKDQRLHRQGSICSVCSLKYTFVIKGTSFLKSKNFSYFPVQLSFEPFSTISNLCTARAIWSGHAGTLSLVRSEQKRDLGRLVPNNVWLMLNRVRQVELHSNFQKYFSCQPAQFSLHQKIEIFFTSKFDYNESTTWGLWAKWQYCISLGVR